MITFLSCGNKTFTNKTIDQPIATIKNSTTETESTDTTEFYIKDETMYSENFISEFKFKFGMYEKVSLIEDTIAIYDSILNGVKEDISIIPTNLPLNKTVIYSKTEKNKKQVLTVKRINISTLEYNYYEIVNGKKTNNRQGIADLNPSFYLSSKMFDDGDGLVGMYEYADYSEKDCWTYIYIEVESIEKSCLIYGCETDRNKFRTPILHKD